MTEEAAVEESGVEEGGFDMESAQANLAADLGLGQVEEEDESVFEEESDEIEEDEPETEESEEEAEEESEEVETEEVESEEVDDLPTSWKKEMKETWSKLDATTKEYINQRESQMKAGLEKDRGDANLGRTMRDTMAPYSQMLKSQGVDEPGAVKALLSSHYRLSSANPQEKAQLFNQLAQSYGVDIKSIAEQPPIDPALQSMQNELYSLRQTLSQNHESTVQAARDRVTSDVEKFSSDPAHQYFDEVSDEIVEFLKVGNSLEDAYEKAVWGNPITRQKEVERVAAEKLEQSKKTQQAEVAKAKKAKATNVKGRDTRKTPTGPKGTMNDTLNETLREIKSRTH